jgi:hypothetical protein
MLAHANYTIALPKQNSILLVLGKSAINLLCKCLEKGTNSCLDP